MRCVCGYNGGDQHVSRKPFIELAVIERGPFFAEMPDVWPIGGSIPAIKRGAPTKMYACPKCGTVRIEV